MNFFFIFKNELLLARTSRQFKFSGQISAFYNHENQADRQSCHSSSKPCSEIEGLIWNILPQLWLKLLLHTFQFIAMTMHRFFTTVCCIKFNKNVIGMPLCTQNCRAPLFMTTKWSRNRGGGTTKMPIPCMPANRYITAQVTLLRKKYDHCINQCVQSSWLLSWLGSIFHVAKSNLD